MEEGALPEDTAWGCGAAACQRAAAWLNSLPAIPDLNDAHSLSHAAGTSTFEEAAWWLGVRSTVPAWRLPSAPETLCLLVCPLKCVPLHACVACPSNPLTQFFHLLSPPRLSPFFNFICSLACCHSLYRHPSRRKNCFSPPLLAFAPALIYATAKEGTNTQRRQQQSTGSTGCRAGAAAASC